MMDQEAAAAARLGYHVAPGTDPDQYARAQQLARELGVPTQTALADAEALQRKRAAAAIDFDKRSRENPQTAGLLADPERAKIAHDDVPALSGWESAARGLLGDFGLSAPAPETVDRVATSLTRPLRSAAAAVWGDLPSATWGLAETAAKNLSPALDPLVGSLLPENPIARMGAAFEDYRKRTAAVAERVAGDQSDAGLVESSINSGFRSFEQMLPGMGAAVATGNPWFAIGGGATLAGSQAATKGLDAGLPPWHAALYGAEDAAAEALTEMAPTFTLLRNLKAGAPFLSLLRAQIAAEVPTELAATAWQNFNAWANLHPDTPITTYLDALPGDAARTLIATVTTTLLTAGLGAGLHGAMQRGQQRQNKAQQATGAAQLMTQLNTLAAASKVRTRDPAAAQAFFQSVLDDGHEAVYIAPAALAQSGMAEQLTAAIPAVGEQLQTAAATGHDLRIPIADLMANLAGPELEQGLIPHLSTEPGGFTATTAQAYFQTDQAAELQAEVERLMGDEANTVAFKIGVEQVKTTIRAELDNAGRFTPEVNTAYATLVGQFYGVQAARLGVMPEALYARYPLRVTPQGVTGETLSQPTTAGFQWEFGQRPGLFALGPVPVTQLRGDELGTDRDAIRAAGLARLKAIGQAGVRNADTGWSLAISRQDRGKIAAWAKQTDAALQSIGGIEQLIARAVLAESHHDTLHDNPDVQAVHRLYAPVEIAGTLFRAKLTVRDYASPGRSATNFHASCTRPDTLFLSCRSIWPRAFSAMPTPLGWS